MADEKYSVPQRSGKDVAHTIAKAGLSAVPYVGSPAAELLQLVIQPPLEKRREKWMEEIAQGLRDLETKGLKIEDLQQNEQFISAVLHASQIALRTHKEEKRAALRNAVLNVARGQSTEEALQIVFLNLVDLFTEWHLRILRLFQAPPAVPGLLAGGLSDVLERTYPELKGQREFYDPIWRDLYFRNLVSTEALHGTMSAHGSTQKRTTNLGDKFLSFIAEPKE